MPYRITFVVNRFNGPKEQGHSHDALVTLLNALMDIDVQHLTEHPETPLLYDSGVRYQEEPVGSEDWQDIPTTLKLGVGDCEDLACWRAAELRVRWGIFAVPCFTWKVRPDGGMLYHIQVALPNGQMEDPSRRLGML